MPDASSIQSDGATQQVWRELSKYVLTPEHPHALHLLLLRAAFAGWDTAKQVPTSRATLCMDHGYQLHDLLRALSCLYRAPYQCGLLHQRASPTQTSPRSCRASR